MFWSFWREYKTTLGAILFCLSGAALFFRGPLFFPTFYHVPYDLVDYHLPLSEFIASSLRETGQLPWWNPYSYMGEPFLGNIQAAMFYPMTLLTVLLGNVFSGRVSLWWMEIELAIHVALAGIGMYVFLRMLKNAFSPSLAGAAVYSLGAFFASQAQHLGAIAEAAWLPWFLASLYRLEQRRDWPSTALSGLSFALMILPGFPAAYLPVAVFAPLVFGFWLWERQPRRPLREYARPVMLLAAAFSIGILISAVSWLPGYEVGRQSVARNRAPAQALIGLPLEAATSLVWPNLLNQLQGMPWSSENITFLHIYQGVPALLLVFAVPGWTAGSRRSRAFLVAAIIAALWMFGTVFFASFIFYGVYPPFLRRGIYPDFVLAYFSLFFAGLAAFSLDAWERGERDSMFHTKSCLRAGSLTFLVSLILLSLGAFFPGESVELIRTTASGRTLLLVTVFFLLCGFLSGLTSNHDPVLRKRLSAALCGLIVLDLITIGSQNRLNSYDFNGDVPSEIAGFLHARLGDRPIYRIETYEAGYSRHVTPVQWRIPSANGMNPFLQLDTVAYRLPFSRLDPVDRNFVLTSADSPLVDLAGIRYIVTKKEDVAGTRAIYRGDLNVFENPRAMPRFFLVGAVSGIDGIDDVCRMIDTRRVDPSRVVLIPVGDVPYFSGINSPATSDELGTVELLSYTANEFRVRVTTHRPAAFVATETYARDWHATLDGSACPLVRADGIFRALPVPPGTHDIRVFFRPRMLYGAALLSLSGLLLAGCCLFVPWGLSARQKPPGSPELTR